MKHTHRKCCYRSFDETLKPFELQGELNSLLKRDRKDKIQGLLRPLTEHKEKENNELIKAFNEALFEYEIALNSWCANALKRLRDLLSNITDSDPDYPIPFELSDFWIPSIFEDAKLLSVVISKLANKTRNLWKHSKPYQVFLPNFMAQ